MTDLDALIAKVEGLTGADREVDALIWSAATGHQTYYPNPYVHEDDGIRAFTAPIEGMGPMNRWQRVPPLTSDLNAIVKLVEAKLPGSHWRVEKTCEHPALSFRTHQFTGYCGDWGKPSRAEGPTPALALTAALLRALKAQEEGKP